MPVEFVVVHRGKVIGMAGRGTLPEVGYFLHPDSWGKGLVHEAMQAVIDYAFANHPVDQPLADVARCNAGSIRLLDRPD